MRSAFSLLQVQNPAEALFLALTATVFGIVLLLVFILSRRAIRRCYFARRDRRNQHIRHNWDKIVSGGIPARQWFFDRIDHPIVEQIALDRMDVAEDRELKRLQKLVRESGLLDKRLREVRYLGGWRRRQSLLALGRMRIPESIPAFIEALEDRHEEVVVDSIRGLGQVGTPLAAEAILRRMSASPVQCPPQILQSALLHCYRFHAPLLLARVLDFDDAIRPVLARVLAEVATPDLTGDLLVLAADPLPEVRASAARILAVARPHYALTALTRLATDKEWFVRLRAVVALGELRNKHGIPALVRGLCDSNRLVRLRAASALVRFVGEEERILQFAMHTGDRYAMQALVSEMERSGRIPDLVNSLADDSRRPTVEPALLGALQGGSMHILIDLLLNQANRCVRDRLARLLAGSGDPALLQQLEQVELKLAARRHQRLLRWVIRRLRDSVEDIRVGREAVAV